MNITNRQHLIEQLQDPDFIDDSGASYEATIYYNIACPYFWKDERALCTGKPLDTVNSEMCFECKEKWLDSEIDM